MLRWGGQYWFSCLHGHDHDHPVLRQKKYLADGKTSCKKTSSKGRADSFRVDCLNMRRYLYKVPEPHRSCRLCFLSSHPKRI